MPSKSKIFDYWKDKGVIIDWGEPSCWACGKWRSDYYDIKSPNASMKEIRAVWNKISFLQRCHIVPVSLGGSNDPSNFYLMCAECHNLQPNTSSAEVFFRWVKNQSQWKRIEDSVKSFDLSDVEIAKINLVLIAYSVGDRKQKSHLRSYFDENIGKHWLQGSGSVITTISSFIGIALDFPISEAKKMAFDNPSLLEFLPEKSKGYLR
jgi:HNH endonuclease